MTTLAAESVCRVCGASLSATPVHSVPSDNRAVQGRMFRVRRCPGCRTIHGLDAEPVTKSAEDYSLRRQTDSFFNRAVCRRTLTVLRRDLRVRREDLFLAYGMRNNVFLNFLNRRIPNFFAYDPYISKFNDMEYIRRRKYDVVFMENVFGQFPDPRSVLKEVHGLLNKGGLLFLNAPNADRIDLTLPDNYLMELHAPYRYHIFAPDTLVRLAQGAGFDVARVQRERGMADTLIPFVNWRFMRDYAKARDNTIDALFDSRGRLRTVLKNPRLIVSGFLGGIRPAQTEAVYFFKKAVGSQCRICRSANLEFVYKNTFEEVDLVRCRDCGVVFLDLREGTADRFYSKDYYPNEPLLFEKLDSWARARDLGRMLPPESRVFEIGCGHGLTLRRLDKMGHEVYGNEFTEDATAYAENRLYLKMFGGHVDHIAIPRKEFDLVFLYHVFEHLPDPVGTLKLIHGLLRPGGRMVLEVPNLGSFPARIFGRRWFFLTLPKHLFHFNRGALSRLVEANGFRIQRVRTRYLLYDAFGWAQSILNVILRTQDILNAKEVRMEFGLSFLRTHPRLVWEWMLAQILFPFLFAMGAGVYFLSGAFGMEGSVIRLYAEKADMSLL